MAHLVQPRPLSAGGRRRKLHPWIAIAAATVVAAITVVVGTVGSTRAAAAQTGTKTITGWFVKDDDIAKVLPQLDQEFEKQHPGVKIDLKLFAFTQLQTKARLALAGNSPPDIAQTGNQPALASELIAAGKLLDLQKYALKYGWLTRFSKAWMNIQGTFNPKTGKPGKGDAFGLWQAIAPLVVYYNKAKLHQLGLSVPTTYEQFVADMAKAKAAGEQPLMLGSVDKWPALHEWYMIADQLVDRQTLAGILGHKAGATMNVKGLVDSVGTLQSWTQKGYLPSNFYGLGYDDSIKQFGQGDGLFYITGSWASNTFYSAMKDNVGVFVMPPRRNHPLLTTDSTNWPLYISAKTKNPDLVAEYMNFISSDRAGQLMAAKGSIPAMKMSSPVKASNPVYAALFKAAATIVAHNAEVNYLDAATASIYDVMAGGLQEVLAGQQTPQSFIDSLQKNYLHP